MDGAITLDMPRQRWGFFYLTYYFTNHHLFYHLPSLASGLSPIVSTLTIPQGAEVFHSHPQLLVPEQQFASGFIELQPVNLGVLADGSQIAAPGQVH